ncbi:hypothetical protein CTAYLR_001867 [Chrysophaeum taylorii]|uniref:Phytanoyl-CoA dioxygenase n=1 Tax=Chrysophaeum taylorii TaxID=2483200 RepID=A0AAD7U890_9STRA|nr:hypothetical protein CTAYLR_001867 [Chrysophaeum taylorii]
MLLRRNPFRGVVSSSSSSRVDVDACLPASAIAQFRKKGAVMLPKVVSASWVAALREAAEANMKCPGPLCDEHAAAQGTGGRFHDDQFLWKRHGAFEEYVLESGVGGLAARAMGSKSAHIFYDQLLVKEPGTVAPTPWHNDTSYWQLDGSQICSVWLALDDVAAECGVSYVSGSHLSKIRHAVTNFSGDHHSDKNTYAGSEPLDPVPDVDALEREGSVELLKWDMEPGDAILFSSYAIHGAPGTPAKANRRRGYATRWCGDDVTFDARPGTMAAGWAAAGYDARLQHGDRLGKSALHPDVLRT